MNAAIVAASRGTIIRFEVCPNAGGGHCACEDEPIHEHHEFIADPPDAWPNLTEPWRETATTPEQIQAARDAWAQQCAREALLLVEEKYAPKEPEDITGIIANGG